MISDNQVEESLLWLRDSPEMIAKAKATLELLDSQTKSQKAVLMRDFDGSSANREMLALSDTQYHKHLLKVSVAVEEYEKLRLQRDYHMCLVEAWRTSSSNHRALGNFR